MVRVWAFSLVSVRLLGIRPVGSACKPPCTEQDNELSYCLGKGGTTRKKLAEATQRQALAFPLQVKQRCHIGDLAGASFGDFAVWVVSEC
eukprot:2286209-Amphidinium_carterae.1